MCDGFSEIAAVASLASAAIGTATSMASAHQQAQAQSQASAYQAQVANNNSIMARSQADSNAEAVQRQNSQKAGQMRAAIGANGVDMGSGSAADVQNWLAETGGMDVANTRYNGDVKATGFRSQAILDSASSENAQAAGSTAVASSLVSGASQFSSKWSSFQNSGAI